MNPLADLRITDIRHLLPKHGWLIGYRTQTTSLTWHWNGPAVPDDRRSGRGLIEQLVIDAAWQMRPGWGGTIHGAPHLMYHIVVGADGQAYQTSEINEQLWHCAHQDGNGSGLALHFVLGKDQPPTAAQMRTGLFLTNSLRDIYRIPRHRVLGHLEWKHATECPGPLLMRELQTYRNGQIPAVLPTPIPAGIRRFKISPHLLVPARVRQEPRTTRSNGSEVPVATRLKPGTIVYVDVVKTNGEPIKGNPNWVHMARIPNEQADAGFISETLGSWL